MNLYPNASFQTYGSALCGVGVTAPIFAGMTFMNLKKDEKSPFVTCGNKRHNEPFKYFPLCAKGNCIQRYDGNYTGAHTGEYVKCQR
jgi:hypothetical protein